MRRHDGRQPISNYAFKRTAELALGPNQVFAPQPLNAALDPHREISVLNNADQLSEIRPGLREVLSGGENVCVTFEVEEREKRWVQYVGGTINAAYFMSDAPDISKIPTALHEKLGKITLVGWEPLKFMTLGIENAEVSALAKLIDWVFTEIQNCEFGEYHLNVSVEDV